MLCPSNGSVRYRMKALLPNAWKNGTIPYLLQLAKNGKKCIQGGIE